jgi:hypothetical protein
LRAEVGRAKDDEVSGEDPERDKVLPWDRENFDKRRANSYPRFSASGNLKRGVSPEY